MAKVVFISSRGKQFNLLDFDSAKLQKADFHDYKWNKEVISRRFGEIVNRFTKSAQTYDCTFKFRGSFSNRAKQIEELHYETEYDIAHLAAGKLYWNNSYIECFIIESDTYPEDDGSSYTVNEVKLYCPYPFWINEQLIEIYPSDGQPLDNETAKGYTQTKYGYPYNYTGATTNVFINTEHYKDSDFKMIAYGPTNSVRWTIGDNLYEVNYPLRANQYMVIDSRQTTPPERQCFVVSENGITTNVFDYRGTDGELFKKIPAGSSILNYPRTYGLQLTIFKERSEPI